jgi:hypothetical protein
MTRPGNELLRGRVVMVDRAAGRIDDQCETMLGELRGRLLNPAR